MRLQKILATAGITSRRKSEELIKAGLVTVNGLKAEIGQSADPETDVITVNGKPLPKPKKRYILLHKPAGYVCTTADPHVNKIVTNLVNVPEKLYPVGRLDKETEGLLLLTNDGDFTNRVIHPRYETDKVYIATLNKELEDQDLQDIAKGIKLEDFTTRPAKIRKLEGKQAEITIHEGKKRIVRRMFSHLGYDVEHLIRIRLGHLIIENLKSGAWRDLTQAEIAKFNTS